MQEKPCCEEGLRSVIGRKLGRCPRCIRWSAYGTLAGWVVAAAVGVTWPEPAPLGLALLVSASFTGLLIAHLVVFTRRSTALWHVLHFVAPEGTRALWPTRRAFMTNALGLSVVLAAVLGRRGVPAASQQAERTPDPSQIPTSTTGCQGCIEGCSALFNQCWFRDFSNLPGCQEKDDIARIACVIQIYGMRYNCFDEFLSCARTCLGGPGIVSECLQGKLEKLIRFQASSYGEGIRRLQDCFGQPPRHRDDCLFRAVARTTDRLETDLLDIEGQIQRDCCPTEGTT